MEPSACPDEDQLTRLADGVLPPDEAAALGAHTESCASCRRLVGLLVKLKSSKRELSTTLPSADTAPAIKLGTELGRYVTRRFVGAGAMGVVFEAEDPALQRRVAIKVMRSARSATAQELLKREAQVMAQLSHRNVATVFDVGVVDERSWVAMEFIEGPTPRSWLQSEPRSEQAILARILEAGSGLAAAHKAGVIHRDFKPDNVLVETSSARVVVTDFGLSAGSGEGSLATPSGSIVGTPAYMAPEQRLGNADAASDQFAFCISAVEAFTGRRPFDTGRLDAQILAQVPGACDPPSPVGCRPTRRIAGPRSKRCSTRSRLRGESARCSRPPPPSASSPWEQSATRPIAAPTSAMAQARRCRACGAQTRARTSTPPSSPPDSPSLASRLTASPPSSTTGPLSGRRSRRRSARPPSSRIPRPASWEISAASASTIASAR